MLFLIASGYFVIKTTINITAIIFYGTPRGLPPSPSLWEGTAAIQENCQSQPKSAEEPDHAGGLHMNRWPLRRRQVARPVEPSRMVNSRRDELEMAKEILQNRIWFYTW